VSQVLAIVAVAALAVAFGLLSRRRDGAAHDACSKSEPPEGGCGSCSLDCDRPETKHVRP